MDATCCKLCHRILTDPVAIAVGYGPICAQKAGIVGHSSHLPMRRRKIMRVRAWRRLKVLFGEKWSRDRLLFPELDKHLMAQVLRG